MTDREVERVLAEMAATDERRGRDARAIFEWLTAGEGIGMIDLASVQQFVWYSLPVKWMAAPEAHVEVADAGRELFTRLGFDSYAAVFASSETAEILDAYARSDREGLAAFRRAWERSGIDAPDLEDFAWGDVMGWEEASARSAVERALEAGLVSGELRPGASGWRSVARTITARTLDSPHQDLPGQRLRDAVITERLGDWVDRGRRRSPRLGSLRSAHANRLLNPIPVPDDVAERLAPLTWFLQRVDGSIRLTQAGYLPPSLVREAYERFEWGLAWTDRPPNSESEAVEIFELHHLARRLGAVRKRRAELYLTERGRSWLTDVERGWRAVSAGLSDGAWSRTVAEAATLIWLDGARREQDIFDRVAELVAEAGWQADGEPPDRGMVMSAWYHTRRPLAVFGGIEELGDWRNREIVLTGFGQATLLDQIRADATGPRSSPW